MSRAYYNEIDKVAAHVLREIIAAFLETEGGLT